MSENFRGIFLTYTVQEAYTDASVYQWLPEQGSTNCSGSRAGWAPVEHADGPKGEILRKNEISNN